MPPERDDSFVEMLRRSGLIESRRLDEALSAFPPTGEGATDNTRLIARTLIERGLLTEWQHQNLRQGRLNGFFVGRYKLLDVVAGGGMGTVYLAEHALMKRRVALKVLRPALGAEQVNVDRFYREARAAAMLDHPNIVSVHDVGSDGDFHFLAMEYLEGQTLRDLVVKDGLPNYDTAAEYIRQAAEALAYAHARSIVHRDIKPENFFVLSNGTLKVLDLGLARITRAGEEMLTMTDNMLGTVDYMSPEQAQDSHEVGPATDIYSLGCTLYFVLTGHPPFPTGTAAQRLVFHLMKTPTSVYQERPTAPCGLVAICERMMAKMPDDRYPSAVAVLEALTAWRDEYRGLATTPIRLDAGSPSIDLREHAGVNAPTPRIVKPTASGTLVPSAGSSVDAPSPERAAPSKSGSRMIRPGQVGDSLGGIAGEPRSPSGTRPPSASATTGPVSVRVSLSKLLAYRDGTLAADAAAQMRAALKLQPLVAQLLDRIERVTARSWMTTPTLDGSQADVAVVAAWLDGTLEKESRRSFEQLCLKSDEFLAELASLHRIRAQQPPLPTTLTPGPTTPEEQAQLSKLYALGVRAAGPAKR